MNKSSSLKIKSNLQSTKDHLHRQMKTINRTPNNRYSKLLFKTDSRSVSKQSLDQKNINNPETIYVSLKISQKQFNLPQITVKNIENLSNKVNKKSLRLRRNLFRIKSTSSTEQKKFHKIVGYSCQGGRINNQDRIVIETIQTSTSRYDFLGIFDGHAGSLISNYLASYLNQFLKKQLQQKSPQEAITTCLAKVQQKIKNKFKMNNKSGSCVLLVLINKNQAWIANIGDSRLLSIDKNHILTQITNDHKPQMQNQRLRIQSNGGRVYRNKPGDPYRAYPGGLSVTRTIGDIQIKKKQVGIIISQPQIFYLNLSQIRNLILFSDGIYQKISNNEIASFFLQNQNLQTGLKNVFQTAAQLNSRDNRSMIAVQIK